MFCKFKKKKKEKLYLSGFAEFFMYRIVFLMMGIALLSLASTLSISLAFYYFGAMSVGIIILATLIISQVKLFNMCNILLSSYVMISLSLS